MPHRALGSQARAVLAVLLISNLLAAAIAGVAVRRAALSGVEGLGSAAGTTTTVVALIGLVGAAVALLVARRMTESPTVEPAPPVARADRPMPPTQRRESPEWMPFVSRLSLELRTHLTANLGYGELLREEAQRTERFDDARDVERLLASGRAALELVEDTVALIRLEEGQVSPTYSHFRVGTLLHEVVSHLRPMAASQSTLLHLDQDEARLGAADTDRDWLRHVIWNLVARAARACPGGRVELQATRVEGSPDVLRLVVRDDGPPLTPDQLEQIFAVPAEQSAPDSEGPGSSLGLVLARRFTRELGGRLSAHAGGEGTQLTLEVPLTR